MSVFISYIPKGTTYVKMDFLPFNGEFHVVYRDINEGSVYVRKASDFGKFEDLGDDIDYNLPALSNEVPCKVKVNGEWKAGIWLQNESELKDVKA